MAASSAPASRAEHEGLKQLCSFLNFLLEQITNDLQNAEDNATQFLQHCKERCSSLIESAQMNGIKENLLQDTLRKTAHLVLDFTYLDETQLVDAEFPVDSCMNRIAHIEGLLDCVCDVAVRCYKDKPLQECLGTELLECVRWRKGALLYMYCHTVETQGRTRDPVHYKKYLEEGVQRLEAMLSTQQPQTVSSEVGVDDTLQLISQGVYSDTHLLAMMYAAEMCYWHQRASDVGTSSQDKAVGDSFLAKEHGIKHLNNYLSAVKGPLKDHNWNTSRAEELLQYLS